MFIMFIIVHIYTQLFTSSLDRRLIIQHANMLIALRKEHLQDTEPFLRHLDLAAVRSPYNHIHLDLVIMHKATVLLIVLNEYSSNMFAW